MSKEPDPHPSNNKDPYTSSPELNSPNGNNPRSESPVSSEDSQNNENGREIEISPSFDVHEETKDSSSEAHADSLLKAEAKAYRQMKPKKVRGQWNYPHTENEEKEQYVISKKWMKKWKGYVGLHNLDRGMEPTGYEKSKREHPGSINEDILKVPEDFYCAKEKEAGEFDIVLRDQLSERLHYKLINYDHWEFFYSRYGGVPLMRKLYKASEYSTWYRAEVYYQEIPLVILPQKHGFATESLTPSKPIYISKFSTLEELRQRMILILNRREYNFQINVNNFRLWKLNTRMTFDSLVAWCEKNKEIFELENQGKEEGIELNSGIAFKGAPFDVPDLREQIIDKCDICYNDTIVMERADLNNNFVFKFDKDAKVDKCEGCYTRTSLPLCCSCKEVYYCSEYCRKKDMHYHMNKCTAIDLLMEEGQPSKTESSREGLAGLQNLGNTCFMNAGLQCLSNTRELLNFFLDDLFKEDLNVYNALGTKGKLANAFSRLMRDLHYGEQEVVSPWLFKRILAKFQPMFSGYTQHDSQELISYILDGLHEDLNRVKYKLYIERKDVEDPGDNSLNKDSWNGHLKRNQSIIVDLMHGQFKSTIHCPECSRFSVTFDPFNTISVPIREQTTFSQKFYFLYYNGKLEAVASAVLIDKTDTIESFRGKVSKQLSVPEFSFVIGMNRADSVCKLLCRKRKMKTASKCGDTMLLHQINPEIFEGEFNLGLKVLEERKMEEEKRRQEEKEANKKTSVYSEMEGYGGNKKKSTYSYGYGYSYYNAFSQEEKVEDDDDFNNGFTSDVIKAFITLKYEHTYYQNYKTSKVLGPPRLLTLLSKMSCLDLHLEIFKYFKHFMDIDSYGEKEFPVGEGKMVQFKDLDYETAFGLLFPHLTEENWKDALEEHADIYPYTVRLVNRNSKGFYKKPCFFCGNFCDNCYLPFTRDKTLLDYLERIPTYPNSSINEYYFKREATYYSYSNDDDKYLFELESMWNSNVNQRILSESSFQSYKELPYLKENSKVPKLLPTLYNCLDQFVKPEKLAEGNEWYCSKCQKHIRATKQMQIFKSPPILIVHLKRFKTGSGGMSGSKITTEIDCPIEELDMSKYILSESQECKIYDLYGAVHHTGSMGFGHYIAYAKSGGTDMNIRESPWYLFDDSHVSMESDPREAISPATYVLFYRRRDMVDILQKGIKYEELKEVAEYTEEEKAKLLEEISKLESAPPAPSEHSPNNSNNQDGEGTYASSEGVTMMSTGHNEGWERREGAMGGNNNMDNDDNNIKGNGTGWGSLGSQEIEDRNEPESEEVCMEDDPEDANPDAYVDHSDL